MSHRFKTGGTCAECGQLWPCQPALALAQKLSESTRKATDDVELRFFNGHAADCLRRGGATRLPREHGCTCGFLDHLLTQP